ncbi:MAG: hypothetical protein ACTSW4_05645 [Candidatus Ranarchaeia archaeon]
MAGKGLRFSWLTVMSVLLLLLESVIIIFTTNFFVQLGLFASGLLAALTEIFYENAGVKQGSWVFHESNQKVGELSFEFIPVASCGTVVTGAFIIWLGETDAFPLGGYVFYAFFEPYLTIGFGVLTILTFVGFTWQVFIQRKSAETLWLVIPLFMTGISLLGIPAINRIAITMTLTIYLSTFLESILLKRTNAYTYVHGYRPAVTSLSYAFFTTACFLLLIGDNGAQMERLMVLSPFVFYGLFVVLITILLVLVKSIRQQKKKMDAKTVGPT